MKNRSFWLVCLILAGIGGSIAGCAVEEEGEETQDLLQTGKLPKLTVSESGRSTVVAESNGTDTFTVSLSVRPAGTVGLRLSSLDPFMATVSPSSLVFQPAMWNVPKTVTVRGVDDGIANGDRYPDIRVAFDPAASVSSRDAVADAVVHATVLDDDRPGIIVQETGGSTVLSEAGGTDTLNIKLSVQPSNDVLLMTYSAHPSAAVTVFRSMSFTPSTWNMPQTLTVRGVDDTIATGNRFADIHVEIEPLNTDSPEYDSVPPVVVKATVLDND